MVPDTSQPDKIGENDGEGLFYIGCRGSFRDRIRRTDSQECENSEISKQCACLKG
jgi:hypothetical protein